LFQQRVNQVEGDDGNPVLLFEEEGEEGKT
jgi:hypothetical protein